MRIALGTQYWHVSGFEFQSRLEQLLGAREIPKIITSGSLRLDSATQGGLPRGRLVTLHAAGPEPVDPLVISAAEQLNALGSRATVIDLNFLPGIQGGRHINDPNLLVIEPEERYEVMPAIDGVLRSRGAGLLVVQSAPDVPGLERSAEDLLEELQRKIQELYRRVAASAPAVVLSHRDVINMAKPNVEKILAEARALQLTRKPARTFWKVLPPLGRNAYEVYDREKAGEVRLAPVDLNVDGKVSKMADLVEAATNENVLVRQGGQYVFGGEPLGSGRRSIQQQLAKQPRIALEVQNALYSRIYGEIHRPFPGLQVGRQANTDKQEERGGRVVNTWFEGDSEPVLPLIVGNLYKLKLNIGAPLQKPGGVEVTDFIEPDFGGKEWIDLVISFFSEDFEIATRNHVLGLPRLGDSATVEASVQPIKTDNCRLNIVISLRREMDVLQRLRVEVQAVAAPVRNIAVA